MPQNDREHDDVTFVFSSKTRLSVTATLYPLDTASLQRCTSDVPARRDQLNASDNGRRPCRTGAKNTWQVLHSPSCSGPRVISWRVDYVRECWLLQRDRSHHGRTSRLRREARRLRMSRSWSAPSLAWWLLTEVVEGSWKKWPGTMAACVNPRVQWEACRNVRKYGFRERNGFFSRGGVLLFIIFIKTSLSRQSNFWKRHSPRESP